MIEWGIKGGDGSSNLRAIIFILGYDETSAGVMKIIRF
jgi:hypothetical protein